MASPHIAILGAGPSGLALARILERADIDFVIFERDQQANAAIAQGGTLDLHSSSGQLALQEGGLMSEFRARARYDVPITMADHAGNVIFSHGEDGGESTRPEIDRKDLRSLLLNAVSADKIRWGHRVECVRKENDGSMSIMFANSRRESGFRLVVGADGAWSKLRPLVTSAKPVYSGLHYLTTSITPASKIYDDVHRRVKGGCYMAFGANKQCSLQALTEQAYHLSIGLRIPEHFSAENAALFEDPDALRQALLRDYFSDWSKTCQDLIENSDGAFRAWPLYAMPVESLSWKTVPGAALIGDAAHVTTPFVGEGVNCALFDSVQLAKQIIKHGIDDLYAAVEEYEKDMFPRAIDLISRSEKSGELMYADDAPKSFLDALMSGEI